MRPPTVRRITPFLVFLAVLAVSAIGAAGPVLASEGPAAKAGNGRAGCDRIGRRVLTAVFRDDIVAASDLTHLYERFACDVKHLRRALDCVAATEPLPQQAAQVAVLIDGCWAEAAAKTPVGAKSQTKTQKAPTPAK